MLRLRTLAARLLVMFGTAGLLLACSSDTTEPRPDPPRPGPRRVLFIGNSLTYSNDLPGMVKALAGAAGATLTVESVTQGGYSLEDHWNEGTALGRLAATPFDLVILQQGPSGTPASRTHLATYVKKWDTAIHEAGARTAVYMVWPEISRPTAFDSVADNYTAAAENVGAMLFPGIRAWQAAWARDAGLTFYTADGLHPTPLGTYLVAVMMVHQVTGKSAVGLPAEVETEDGVHFSTTPAMAQLLQEAAEEAAREWGRE